MGYNSCLVYDHLKGEDVVACEFSGQTHNTHRLIYHAMGCCFYELNQFIAETMILPLRLGISRIEADPESYRRYEPENKWGTVESSLKYMRAVLAACLNYPDAKYDYSG